MNEYFAQTEYLIEATGFERNILRTRNANACAPLVWNDMIAWKQATVGRIGGRPIVVMFCWAKIDGVLVAFWELGNSVFDRNQVRKWFEANCNPRDGRLSASCTAINFHRCIEFVRNRNRSSVRSQMIETSDERLVTSA